MNLATIFHDAASRFATKPVLRYRDEDVLFSEFSDQVAQFSGHLKQRGVGLGDRVMIFARNKPEWLRHLPRLWNGAPWSYRSTPL